MPAFLLAEVAYYEALSINLKPMASEGRPRHGHEKEFCKSTSTRAVFAGSVGKQAFIISSGIPGSIDATLVWKGGRDRFHQPLQKPEGILATIDFLLPGSQRENPRAILMSSCTETARWQ